MVSADGHNTNEIYTSLCSSAMEDVEADLDSTIFVAFKGDIKDKDFKWKLNNILENVPNLLHIELEKLKLQKVEPWNSVRVTFNIPREAAERLRILAQNNNQQLRDLGILSVQIEGEGAINLALTQNRGQDVRINGPLGGNNAVRLEAGFPIQAPPGLIRMNNPAAVMMSQSGNVPSSMMTSGTNAELPPRAPRPSSQPDAVDPLLSGIAVQQQSHPSGSLTPQLHPMQSVSGSRQMNSNLQQLQHQQPQLQTRLPQQQQPPPPPPQGIRPSFATPSQVPVPPGWNQLSSGVLQPPPAQGTMGTLTSNQGWKKAPLPGPMQQQFQARPSLATVQTPSHPPPPYPFGSQQTSQAHSNFPQMSSAGQFTAPQLKTLQGGPSRVPTPLQQPHLTSKSPASSPSFQQGPSPASSPTVNQAQQQMGPRPSQANALSQGFQPPVSSPGRNPVAQQGNIPPNFMVMQQQSQGPQGLHSSLGGMPKRLPPGFSAGQTNPSYMQGQVPSTVPGTPVNGGAPQLQANQNVQHPGGQAAGPPPNQMHGASNMMQTSLMGLHGNINNQQAGTGGVPQVNMSSIQGQPQQGPQSQLMGIHQQIVSSQGQMVNIQAQGGLTAQNQLILSRGQLMPQGQMMVTSQNQNLGPAQQRITPPKQMIPQQSQQMMAQHNQMIGPQGQVMMQQNPMIEQMMANQMQGNKQTFSAQSQSSVMAGPTQIMRGPTPNMQGNMVQFTGQMMAPQGAGNSNPQGVGIQGQILRPAGSGPHLQQQHSDTTAASNNDVNLTQMLPDVPIQQGNMVPSHLHAMQGNNVPGNHFSGHGLPYNTPFSGAPNGNQISCGQNPGFPVNKDVTLTSPLLVNLLQSDISTGHFGVNSKQNNQNATKPKKKKPPRKKKNQQVEEQLNAPDSRPAGLEETDQQPLLGEQGINLDSTGPKLSDFASRPPGYPSQAVEQRPLQPIPPQLMQHGQQQQVASTQAQSQQQQQMMMMLMMQQDPKSVRLPVSQGVHPQRGALNPDSQRMPMQQSGNMSVMVSLQGPGSVPPSPDKQRMPLSVNQSLGNNGRKMVYQDNLQNSSSSPPGDGSSVSSLTEGNGAEVPPVSGAPNNMTPHLVISQNQLMMSGPKPGPSPQGASPQQQQVNSLAGSHIHHFPNVGTPSQTSRPKTPNRASPRPYYPQTPNNRPPSTEPSEISLSPERLNASIAGLFPPQINIPLPPRPNLNRGFDQQGLNPTTLKAIGQAPSNLSISNPSGFSASQINKLDTMPVNSGKQPNSGGTKRASPSNSRRSSPGSSRKTAPSPGRQNSKAAKLALAAQQNSVLLQNMELQRNILVGSTSLQTSVSGNFPNTGAMGGQISAVSVAIMSGGPEDNKEGPNAPQDSEGQISQVVQGGAEQATIELKSIPSKEMKMLFSEDQQKKNTTKLPTIEEGKSLMSPAMREAPTSLSQLLDHSGAPNVTIKPSGINLDASTVITSGEELKKMDPILPLPDLSSGKELPNPLNLPPHNTEACTTQVRPELGELNPMLSQNVPAVIQRPVSASSVPTPLPPNQITVFVTSNPITSSANTSASLPSHLQPTLVSTVVTMPNVGNKVMVSEGQSSVQSNPRPQFITPVFINSSSIIQVMKGSQSSTVPASPVTSNTNIMPQSVAVVGSLHIPQNIKFSSGPTPTSTSSSNISSIPTSRSLVINSLAAPIQPPPCSSIASVNASPHPHPHLQKTKDFISDEVNSQANIIAEECSSATSQATPLPSPPHSSSPGSSSNRRSPISSGKGKGKLDKIGQILLTKACKKVTNSPEKGEEQYALDSESESQVLEMSMQENLGTGQFSLETDNKPSTPLTSSLSKLGTPGPVLLSDSKPAATVSASVSSSLSGNTPLSSILSAATPVTPELLPISPSTTGNHSGLAAEPSNSPAEDKIEVHPEQLHNKASAQNVTQMEALMASQQSAGVERPEGIASSIVDKKGVWLRSWGAHCCRHKELDVNDTLSNGQSSEMKEASEKSKTPSRRNSRTEESAVSQEMVENGQRKRSSRPSSASNTAKGRNTLQDYGHK
ncbi:nuclear receptor coactivator 6 isoform X2 [Rhinatrema bivittatum]|uniref:nuclear receptor coactivator 6 isoform X2 n=1 Tax=Rhinatrema bivittatum TaxID=194408 RepID=UPI00112891D6|nr:nuclear receptor coactivator 6 isoform X2 [Rhinatrema bivittatum]